PATETDPRFFAWGYEYDSLQNKPTKVSTFDNDAGYVTTEIQNLDSVLTLGNRGGNKQIKDLAAPTDPNDAVTKIFLENYASLRVGNCDTLFLGDSQWVIIPGISIPNGKFNIAILTTDTISNITSVTATSGGNVTFDGNSPVTARGVCWSTSQNPTTSDPHTTDGNNLGTFTSNITNLTPNTTYYVRAYATNDIGTAYGNEVSFTTPDFPPNCGTVTDRDGNVYKTVIIGSQCWMRENLRTTKYADGTAILLGTSTNSSTPYRYYPNNNSSNVSTYGYLYNLAAALYNEECSSNNPSGVQGICPDGWHLPSSLEWWDLRDTLQLEPSHHCNDDDQNLAKALASSSGWNSHDGACTVGNDLTANNSTGFSSVPAGFYNSGYFNFGEDSYMWTTTGNKNVYSIRYTIKYNEAVLGFDSDQAHKAYSVRCVRNE
ncbi:MAG TPA: FISUMP domain-containing protein, partial [Bacteroidales bacterium]|nr:FISUMP domain-containing protein [Bacteroidales bacterium]